MATQQLEVDKPHRMVGKTRRFKEFHSDILRSCHFLDTIVLAQALLADVTEVTDNRARKSPFSLPAEPWLSQ